VVFDIGRGRVEGVMRRKRREAKILEEMSR
jgi:hypothetical protein